MPTYVYSKEDFIDFIEKQVKSDEVIVFTNEMHGNLSVSKKKGIVLPHQYSDKAFKEEGIGHIAFGETQALGVLIAKKERLSEDAKKAAEKIKKSTK